MGKLNSMKVIRVWILGASVCATIFLVLSLGYNHWAIKMVTGTTEKSTYFGLWEKCEEEKKVDTQVAQTITTKCEAYGDGNLAGFNDAPGKST